MLKKSNQFLLHFFKIILFNTEFYQYYIEDCNKVYSVTVVIAEYRQKILTNKKKNVKITLLKNILKVV